MKLARKIGGNPALAQFELEIMPGAAVEDDKLADVIASNLASHGHPTATVPMGGPPGLVGGRRLAWRPEGYRRTSCRFDHAGRSKGGDEPHDDLIAERIAKAVYATGGTLGGVPILEIAAPSGPGRWLAQSPEPGDRRSP